MSKSVYYRSLSLRAHGHLIWHPRCSTSACLSVEMSCVCLYTSACGSVRVCLQLDLFQAFSFFQCFINNPTLGPKTPLWYIPSLFSSMTRALFMRSSLPSRSIQPASNNGGVNEWLNGRVRWWMHELRRGDLGREKALLCAFPKA